jgi:DNA-binding NtrC family response regulator
VEKILVVDDEEGMRRSLSILLENTGYRVTQAASGEEAIKALELDSFDLLITDLRLEGMSGIELLRHVRSQAIQVPVIIMTAYATVESAVKAMQMGAHDYIVKPFEYEDILHRTRRTIHSALSGREITGMVRAKGGAAEDLSMIVGKSRIMQALKDVLRKVAKNDLPVLITGETGTGKNLFAKAIHLNSARSNSPFLSVNCSSIPEHLLESEIFGHTKGAFTGAALERKGLFEAANGGTIFLDEIGTVPKAVQSKLLGVLQDKVVRKIGSNKEIPVDTRVITATNADLSESIKKGDFREDLYYRINVLHIDIAPLRKRKEDIEILAQNFLASCAAELGKYVIGFTPGALDRLLHYDYPGNVRELHNIVCSSVALSDAELIDYYDLPASVLVHAGIDLIETHDAALKSEEREKRMIIQCLKKHPDNLSAVARELKIGRTTLWRKIRHYRIDLDAYRTDESPRRYGR